jgi:ribosomal-protein-alanine N-acetyltransferase
MIEPQLLNLSGAQTFPTLETERLVLREIAASDAPALFEIHGDAELMRWFGSEPLKDLEGAQKLVDLFAGWRALPNPGVRWGLQVKGETALIGSCGLFNWNRNSRKCTLGYELGRAGQGKGYVQEAVRAALDWGFDRMDLNRVEAQIHPSNVASLKSIRRLGFFEEGRLREGGYWGGRFHDLLQFSLLREEWRQVGRAV